MPSVTSGLGGPHAADVPPDIPGEPLKISLERLGQFVSLYVPLSKGTQTAMARYKRILGDHLHARKLPAQRAEAAVGVAVLNRMIYAGRPDSVRIA